MDGRVLEQYVDKVYGYAVKRTYSREEAEDLSQEILFTALRELPKLRDDSRFDPWLWNLAGNVTKSFRRFMGKQRAMYSYDALEDFSQEPESDEDTEELYASLRTKIAMLSELYRNILILHYYDGLSTKQISDRLSIPEGTVTWRLSEGRKKLKKECMNMEETTLRPIHLDIHINGGGNYGGPVSPLPYVYINDALSQNILYHCYESPKTVEELAKICGVPAYYIEDSLRNLIYRGAVSELSKGKYRTEFIIYSDKVGEYGEKNGGLFLPVMDEFIASMNALTDDTEELNIYTAGKSREELTYLYGMMALEHLSKKHNPVVFTEYPLRYDGFRWSYFAHLLTGQNGAIRGLGREAGANLGSRGTYQHNSWHFGGFSYRRMMFDNEINVCEDILCHREITDKDSAASAIQEGFAARKQDGELTVLIPSFTKEQYEAFIVLAEKNFAHVIGRYSDSVAKYVEGYKKLFPAHLEEDVTRACHYMFLTLYATEICGTAQQKGLLAVPAQGSVCDVMIQFKKP